MPTLILIWLAAGAAMLYAVATAPASLLVKIAACVIVYLIWVLVTAATLSGNYHPATRR